MPQQLNETLVAKGRILETNREKLPKGVLCRGQWPICNVNKLNQNNRMYERAVFEKAILQNPAMQDKMKSRVLFGHAEHPSTGTQSDLQLTSHVVVDTFIDEDVEGNEVVYQTIDVFDTPCGRIVNTLLEAECAVGVSTRAEGDLEECTDKDTGVKYSRVIPENYSYKTTDFTADPSTYGTKPMNIIREIKSELKGPLTNEERVFATTLLEAIEGKGKETQTRLTKYKAKQVVSEKKWKCNIQLPIEAYFEKGQLGVDEVQELADTVKSSLEKFIKKAEQETTLVSDLASVVDEFDAVGTDEEQFDNAMEALYDWADDNDVWVEITVVKGDEEEETEEPEKEDKKPAPPVKDEEEEVEEGIAPDDKDAEEIKIKKLMEGTIEDFVKKELVKAGALVEWTDKKGVTQTGKVDKADIKEHTVTVSLDSGAYVSISGPTPVSVAPDGLVVIPNIAPEAPAVQPLEPCEPCQGTEPMPEGPAEEPVEQPEEAEPEPEEIEGGFVPEDTDDTEEEEEEEEEEEDMDESKKVNERIDIKKGSIVQIMDISGSAVIVPKAEVKDIDIAYDGDGNVAVEITGNPDEDEQLWYSEGDFQIIVLSESKKKSKEVTKESKIACIKAIVEAGKAAKLFNHKLNEAVPDEDMPKDDKWCSDELEKFSKLMPDKGPAETVEGELVRAISKIIYRWYNDGDYFYTGYGLETAGPAAAFLLDKADKLNLPNLAKAVQRAVGAKENDYQLALSFLESVVVDYVESKEGNYTPNNEDMLSFKPDEWEGREEDLQKSKLEALRDEVQSALEYLDEETYYELYRDWVDDSVVSPDDAVEEIRSSLNTYEKEDLINLADRYDAEYKASDSEEDLIELIMDEVAGDYDRLQTLFNDVVGEGEVLDLDDAYKALVRMADDLDDVDLEGLAVDLDMHVDDEDLNAVEDDEGAEVDEDEPLPRMESVEKLTEGKVKEDWLAAAVKAIKAIPKAKTYGVGDTSTDEAIAGVFQKMLKGKFSDKWDAYKAYELLVDEDSKNIEKQKQEADAVAKSITKELRKLASKVTKQITKPKQAKDVTEVFYRMLHFKEKGFAEELVFESYDDMVDYLKNAFGKMSVGQQAKFVSVLPSKALNESKTSLSEMRMLKLKEASARAEVEKAMEMLTEIEKESKVVKESSKVELRVLLKKLKESTTNESKEVKALRNIVEKKIKTTQSLQKELEEAKTSLDETKKIYESKINKLEQDFKRRIVKEYVDLKVKGSAMRLPSNSRALLENCSSLKEVDKVFEDVRDALRRGALLPEGNADIQVHHVKPVDAEAKRIYDQIGNVLDAM